MRLTGPGVLGVVATSFVIAPALFAQQRDTTRADSLARIVITAERAPQSIVSVTSAVTRLTRDDLARVPPGGFAEVLRRVPGVAVVDFDGLGRDPQIMTRGFYGGGEAEYVVVLVDGIPVNRAEKGLVAWDALPPVSSMEAVEVVRGSSSAMYGDAAVAGVINIITRHTAADRAPRWSVAAGSFGSREASADVAGTPFGRDSRLSLGIDHGRGFRDHAERTASRARASMKLAASGRSELDLSVHSSWRRFEEPGPLLESLMSGDRRASDPLFRFDETEDDEYGLELRGRSLVMQASRLSASLGGAQRSSTALRTLALAPGFGDARERQLSGRRLGASLQLDAGAEESASGGRFTIGIDLAAASLESRYYAVVTGDRDAFRASSGARGDIDANGEASRATAALFAHYAVAPHDAVRLSLGVRGDWIRDVFEARAPSTASRTTASRNALSPKAGLNVRYHGDTRASGNLYFTAGRSFKMPTLDQRYDQRPIPVPFPPFSITTSNPDLRPQSGNSFEAGLIHQVRLDAASRAEATLGLYQIDMKDELDFDVETFRYVNIGRSRHRGVEAALSLSSRKLGVFANYTMQSVKSRRGAFAGYALKAIPRHVVAAAVSVDPPSPLEISLGVNHARGGFLDDANTRRLESYTRLDTHLGYRIGPMRLVVDVRNLLDDSYSTTGFLDPSGSGEAYFHPAAGRVIDIGIRHGW